MTFEKKFNAIKAKFADANVVLPEAQFAIEITMTDDDCAGTFYIASRGNGLEVEPYDYRDNTASISATANIISRLLDGRTSYDNAVSTGKLTVIGNEDAVKEICGMCAKPVEVKKPAAKAEKSVETKKVEAKKPAAKAEKAIETKKVEAKKPAVKAEKAVETKKVEAKKPAAKAKKK